jgi:hypothetical protein
MNQQPESSAQTSNLFFRLIRNPIKFRLFLLQKLPAAAFSGLKIKNANQQQCVVSIRYKWFTQNPFRSTYFACLSMAAEMSTGALAMALVYKRQPAVSMLITGNEAKYFKKATGTTIFTCVEGEKVKATIETAISTGEAQTVILESIGRNNKNEVVAEFLFTWSFKCKSS